MAVRNNHLGYFDSESKPEIFPSFLQGTFLTPMLAPSLPKVLYDQNLPCSATTSHRPRPHRHLTANLLRPLSRHNVEINLYPRYNPCHFLR